MRDWQIKTNLGGVPDSNTPTKMGGGEATSLRTENKNAVSRTGQTLAPQDGTAEKTDQLAKALFINGVCGQSMVDGGSAGVYQLTPITGAAGLTVPDSYTHLSGAIFEFEASNVNPGASTLDIGQTAGTLLGTKDLTLPGGAALSGGEVVGTVRVIYDLANDRFEIIVPNVTGVIPIGSMVEWPTETPPTGWFFRDGSALSRATYATLFGIIGTDYGVGDGATTFNIPDDRGLFGIGFDDGTGVDPDAGSVAALGGDTTIGTSTILNAPNVSVYINRRFIGAILTGTGIPADSRIVNWVGTTITIDKDATATATIANIGINFDVVGSRQTDASQGHRHGWWAQSSSATGGVAGGFTTNQAGTTLFSYRAVDDPITDGVNGTPRVSSVTRPNNSSRLPIIRAF